MRDGAPAANLDLDLRYTVNSVEIAVTKSEADGSFEFEAPAGQWEVRAHGDLPEDFDTVSREFIIAEGGPPASLPDLNVSADEAGLHQPDRDATLDRPTTDQPLSFQWDEPKRPFVDARVQVFALTGEAIWYSDKVTGSSVNWDGLGNQGGFVGAPVVAGSYRWRVKFTFPDTMEGRTWSWGGTFR